MKPAVFLYGVPGQYGNYAAALEAAGINDILADYQAQVDAWVEQYK